jgi:hypothetical protein
MDGMGEPSMITDYKNDKQFEELTNPLHYEFLQIVYERNDGDIEIKEEQDVENQRKGIDIWLISSDGGSLPVELKTDKHVELPCVNNVFLEDVSNTKTGALGWTLKCESLVLSYGFYNIKTGILERQYLYDMHDLKQWYAKNRNDPIFNKKYPLKPPIENHGYLTIGRAIPREIIEDFLIAKREGNAWCIISGGESSVGICSRHNPKINFPRSSILKSCKITEPDYDGSSIPGDIG